MIRVLLHSLAETKPHKLKISGAWTAEAFMTANEISEFYWCESHGLFNNWIDSKHYCTEKCTLSPDTDPDQYDSADDYIDDTEAYDSETYDAIWAAI